MTIDYDELEKACEQIIEENQRLLEAFEKALSAKGLSQKTIKNHLDNVDFYVNQYLLHTDAVQARDGITDVSMFFGYWFIRKAMWASESSMRSIAASLKKFYAFLVERGDVDAEDLAGLKAEIKEEMPSWLETLRRYDDPDDPDPFRHGLLL